MKSDLPTIIDVVTWVTPLRKYYFISSDDLVTYVGLRLPSGISSSPQPKFKVDTHYHMPLGFLWDESGLNQLEQIFRQYGCTIRHLNTEAKPRFGEPTWMMTNRIEEWKV